MVLIVIVICKHVPTHCTQALLLILGAMCSESNYNYISLFVCVCLSLIMLAATVFVHGPKVRYSGTCLNKATTSLLWPLPVLLNHPFSLSTTCIVRPPV